MAHLPIKKPQDSLHFNDAVCYLLHQYQPTILKVNTGVRMIPLWGNHPHIKSLPF